MAHSVFQAFITDGGESIVAAASVSVIDEATGLAATLYDGPAGSPISNPTTSAIDGLVRFYLPAGKYKITVTKGAFSKEFRHWPVGEAASKDVGVANGVASLDGTGRIPLAQMPTTLVGALRYMGAWDASAGTPPSVSPNQGEYWVVSVPGSTDLSGITDWKATDWAIYNGAAWQKIDNSEAPVSFLDLTDAPSSYAGLAGQVLVVKATEDGLESYDLAGALGGKQDALVSGTNIKTVNGASLLGSGNLTAGLNNFTEARDTVFPNNTIPLHSLSATGAEANIGVGVFPKGTGAFQLRVDGSKRGDYAVDLQISAAGGALSATGPYSAIGGGSSNQAQNNYSAVFAGLSNNVSATYGTIVGGQNNTVSGSYSFVGGGYNNQAQTFTYITIGGGSGNTASSGYATIGGGNTNTASGTTSTIAGGQSNTASGQDSFIGGGFTNAASGLRSVVVGGSNNTASGNRAAVLAGQQNTCSGESSSVIAGNWAASRSNTGTAIVGMYSGQAAIKTMSKQTTDATPVRMDDDWSSNAVYFMADNSNVSASIQVVGRDGTDDYAAWIEVLLRRASGAGTVAIVGAQVRREIKSGGAAAWAADVVADTTNGGLGLQVTGAASKTIKWFATLVVNERRNA